MHHPYSFLKLDSQEILHTCNISLYRALEGGEWKHHGLEYRVLGSFGFTLRYFFKKVVKRSMKSLSNYWDGDFFS
jgi:hypothetical protein